MADILFITPNMDDKLMGKSFGTMLLATILKENGMSVNITSFCQFGDMQNFDEFLQRAMDIVADNGPKIVSFYTRCDTYHISLMLAKRIKEMDRNIYVVFGGPQSDIASEETLSNIHWVDFVCCGEGENTVVPLFSSLLRRTPDLSVPGLVYVKDGAVIKNPRPQLIEDLDQIPEVDYSYFRGEDISDKRFPIDVGRGCPFSCTFCSTKTFWGRKYRLKSPERIIREMQHIHDQLGITRFAFEHDMFTMQKKQVIETCRLMQTLDFPVSWNCSARLDCLDEELVDLMAASGLTSIYTGIETGSPRMQKLINKNLKLDQAMQMLRYIHSRGIKMTVSFIYGFPEETENDVAQTVKLVADLVRMHGIRVQTHLCTFLPGTELSQRYRAEMQPTQNVSDIIQAFALEECKELIDAYPAVFSYLQEYHTPLRSKLQHLPVFFDVWKNVPEVYSHIAERYGDNILQMYYDFARCNEALLSKDSSQSVEKQMEAVLQDDQFILQLQNEEFYDIVKDICRLRYLQMPNILKTDNVTVEAFCFSPRSLAEGMPLHEIPKRTTVVSLKRLADGKVALKIFESNK